MTRRERERKIKMFGMIGMSILVIGSLATASYAWFVHVPATVTSNSLTIVAPDDYSYYGYKGNTDSSFVPNGTFEHDFEHITPSTYSAMTSFTGVYPGQSKVYCILIASKAAGNAVTLKLNKFVSNNSTKQGLSQKRYIKDTSTEINIGWAIDMTSMASQDGTGYYDAEHSSTSWLTTKNAASALTGDKFNPADSVLQSGTVGNTTITLDPESVDPNWRPISVFSSDNGEEDWASIYLFYRVCFSDATSTLYTEYNNVDGINIPPKAGDRNFYRADGVEATSNCYSGLTFELKEMELKF